MDFEAILGELESLGKQPGTNGRSSSEVCSVISLGPEMELVQCTF